ncbi:MAG: YbaB/EbfC family nucleoid-associated protein [Lactobacillaceae bacterium]|jgi:DNA-binding YbaB/EbfC family protein|nr:YbaB/EbfC family nucleoid-associated protein [Lactobacillaceae bacterium]
MMNIQSIMKQAQTMQKKMEEQQKKLEASEFEGSSAGGMVKITINGKFETKKVAIDKTLVVADEADILEDLIVAAFNDAKTKVDKTTSEAMQGAAGGLNLGGLKLPF